MMHNFKLLAIVVGTALALLLPNAPAQAQATRTWVSGVGDDANPCSRTAPCKTFAGAISKTATGGEINVLDPGGFGAVTITKAITISSESSEAGVLVSGTNGIVVNVASGALVVLRGLDIVGLGTGLDGIKVTQGGNVRVEKCTIRQFNGNGINVATTANSTLTVVDSFITDNVGTGIQITPSGGANFEGVVDHTKLFNNHDGVIANGTSGGTTRIQLSYSDASANVASGVTAQTGVQPTSVFVKNGLLTGNATGAIANGAQATVLASGNTINANGTALSSVNGGALFTYKNNDVNDNGSPGSAPTQINGL